MGEIVTTRAMRREGRSDGHGWVTHRWNMPEGQEPPPVETIIAGKREHWMVTEVVPIESAKYPNAFRARLRRLGPHNRSEATIRDLVRTDGWWTYSREDR